MKVQTVPTQQKNLIFCIHAHQPIGNFGWVFEQAFQLSYRPFVDTLKRYPAIKCVFHLSGPLLDWMAEHQSAYLKELRALIEKQQIEIMGGAYYEPIFGAIPAQDLLGQIDYMNRKCLHHFGVRPKGAWLTERVWDPEIVSLLTQEGIEYTVLDDFHFQKAKLGEETFGYYTAMSKNKAPLDVFSSSRRLRYLIPFRLPGRLISFLSSLDLKPNQALTFADDCEKFGFWPGTYGWVYEKKWLEQFFEALSAQREWLNLGTFTEFRKRFPSQGEIEIPHASYAEMMEWSGGSFHNFLDKYSESRYMSDRMKLVSNKYRQIESQASSLGEASQKKLEEARLHLYRAQCNCAYWHGVFGGLYLSHLRSAVYEHLMKAEKVLSDMNGSKGFGVTSVLLDESRRKLQLLNHPAFNAYIDPQQGGALVELDYKPVYFNLSNTLARRPEAYHAALLPNPLFAKKREDTFQLHRLLGTKEKNLKSFLIYDSRGRHSLVDHWSSKPLTPKAVHRNAFKEEGNFSTHPYEPFESVGQPGISLARFGCVRSHGDTVNVRIVKSIVSKTDTSLAFKYTLENKDRVFLRSFFSVEFNLLIQDPEALKSLDKQDISSLILRNPWNEKLAFEFQLKNPAHLITSPIETVSESEGGMERTFQALALFWEWPVDLEPSARLDLEIELKALPEGYRAS